MPVEGNWERTHAPLRRLSRRELRTFQALAATLLVAVVAVVAVAFTQSSPPVPANCIQVTGGSAVGGANFRVCGSGRRAWCAQTAGRADPTSRAVQARCRALGLSPRRARA